MAAEQSNKELRNREVRARRAAAKHGLVLIKKRGRPEVGPYFLMSADYDVCYLACRYVDDVRDWLTEAEFNAKAIGR